MKPKTMILMAVAIVCGLGASYMTSRLLAERGNGPQEAPKVSVLVAKKQLTVGNSIKKPQEMFELKEFTKGTEPKDAIANFEQLKGKFLKHNLRKGDFVTPRDIDDQQTILDIPDGMVGVAIRVNEKSIAGGFASLPGTRVNIMWSLRGNQQVHAQCVTLLDNVLVVAAGTKNNANEEKSPMLANTVTVALTQEDAQKVMLAEETGTLSLTVRKGDDEKVGKTAKVTFQDLLKQTGAQNPDVVKEPDLSPAPPIPVVQPKPGDPKPLQKKHIVYIKDKGGYKTQVFLVYPDGSMVLESVSQADGPVPQDPQLQPAQPPAFSPTPNGPATGPTTGPASGPTGGPSSGPSSGPNKS